MRLLSFVMILLKWFSILWAICAVVIVAISDLIIAYELPLMNGLLPFDVRDGTKVALLLAPGAIAAAIHLLLKKTAKGNKDSGAN